MDLVRISDETVDASDFVKLLKLNGKYTELLEDVVAEKIAIHAGRRQGIEPSVEQVQERADQIRRVCGLHRAVDMNRWLDELGITLDYFEQHIIESLIYETVMNSVINEESVEGYFKLNSPRFDAILLSHIVVDSENKARELVAIVEEEPDMFEDLAREHSMADTQSEGGYIGRVTRGSLVGDVEAKVFNADPGSVLGPFPAVSDNLFEIFLVNDRRDAQLDSATESEIRRLIKDEWLEAQAKEIVVEVC